jgi:transcriptional regulator with GAF, ATPase, and Fis domain
MFLIGISGVVAGKRYNLAGSSLSIGRQSQSDIAVAELSVSRQHCAIERQEDANGAYFTIRDLESFNGTYVNGTKIEERRLAQGDRIRIGSCEFAFECSEDQLSIDVHHSFVSTMQGRSESFERGPDAVGDGPEIDRYATELSAAFALSTELQTHSGLQPICRALLKHTFDVLPAVYAAFILTESDESADWRIFGESRDASQARNRSISQELISHALKSKELVSGKSDFKNERAIADEAFLIVPLIVQDKTAGVLYAVRSDGLEFDRYHLRFAAMAACTAAPAIIRAMVSDDKERMHVQLLSEIVLQHEIVGISHAIRTVLGKIQRATRGDAPVLISGESGTGKELAARALHLNSERANRPLVAFNCAALSETLSDSELFGHERGAFTGAVQRRRGVFEQADGSTLFLDEIGELPLGIQAKLLRVLERHEVIRLGGEKTLRVDFRLVTATNRDLAQDVRDGKFRADLLYRLKVISIAMPALRERKEDILPIAEHFLTEFKARGGRHVTGFSRRAQDYLEAYGWPGNVRELRNAIEYAVIVGSAPQIESEDFPEAIPLGAHTTEPYLHYHAAVAQARRSIILEAFASAEGSHTEAARILGIHPNNLHRMIRELGLREQIAGMRSGNR